MKSKKLQGALAKLNSKEKASTSLDFQKISTTEALQVVGGKGGGQDIKINFNPDNGQITNVSPGDVVKRPEDFLVKMYGIAKRNGQWHGSRIDNTR